jgi:hypothetical protein
MKKSPPGEFDDLSLAGLGFPNIFTYQAPAVVIPDFCPHNRSFTVCIAFKATLSPGITPCPT